MTQEGGAVYGSLSYLARGGWLTILLSSTEDDQGPIEQRQSVQQRRSGHKQEEKNVHCHQRPILDFPLVAAAVA